MPRSSSAIASACSKYFGMRGRRFRKAANPDAALGHNPNGFHEEPGTYSVRYQSYAWFVAAFREAAEKLRRGDRTACFPAGSFPPALPFVAG